MDFSRLTVYHYGEKTEEDRRITLSPLLIVMVAAHVDDVQINGRTLRQVSVLFSDEGSVDLNLNHQDLDLLEMAVGSFSLG